MAAAKRRSDEHEILEHSRSAALESAADLLESIAHAQKLRKRAEATFEDRRRPGERDGESGDFLMDMLRLNAHYLNELAKLGSRHKAVAHRALENFYSLVNPGVRNSSASELEFSIARRKRRFAVQNDVNPEADGVTLEWAPIEHPKTREPCNPFSISFDGGGLEPALADGRYNVELRLAFGIPKVVELELDANGLLQRRYPMELLVRLKLDDRGREQVRRIPVMIDARERAEGGDHE